MFFEESLELHAYNSPFHVGVKNRLIPVLKSRFGLFDLSNVSEYAITFRVIDAPEGFRWTREADDIYWFVPNQIGEYYIECTYGSHTAYFSFVGVEQLSYPDKDQVYTTYTQELIPDTYSKSSNSITYVDDKSACNTIASAYSMVKEYYDNAFPSTGDIQYWETTLTGFTNIYDDAINTNLILQFLNNIQPNGSMNPYVLSYFVSQYLAYRSGTEYYVYIDEHIANSDDYWVLNQSFLNLSTKLSPPSDYFKSIDVYIFLEGSTLSDEIRFEVNWLIKKILRADLFFNVHYDRSPADFDLIVVRDTWYTDPGLDRYCLKFPLQNKTLNKLQPPLKAAHALVDPYSTSYLESVQITEPISATLIDTKTTKLNYTPNPPMEGWKLSRSYLGVDTVLGYPDHSESNPQDGFQTINYYTLPSDDTKFIAGSGWFDSRADAHTKRGWMLGSGKLGDSTYLSGKNGDNLYIQFATDEIKGFTALNGKATLGFWGNNNKSYFNGQEELLVKDNYNAGVKLYDFGNTLVHKNTQVKVQGTYVTSVGTYTKQLTHGIEYEFQNTYNINILPGGVIVPLKDGIGYVETVVTTPYQDYFSESIFKVDNVDPQVLCVSEYIDETVIQVSFYDVENTPVAVVGRLEAFSPTDVSLGTALVNGSTTINIDVLETGDRFSFVRFYQNDSTAIYESLAERKALYNYSVSVDKRTNPYELNKYYIETALNNPLLTGYSIYVYNPDGTQNSKFTTIGDTTFTTFIDTTDFTEGYIYSVDALLVRNIDESIIAQYRYDFMFNPPNDIIITPYEGSDPYAGPGYTQDVSFTTKLTAASVWCVTAVYSTPGETVYPFENVKVIYNEALPHATAKIYLPPGTPNPGASWSQLGGGSGIFQWLHDITAEEAEDILRAVPLVGDGSVINARVEIIEGGSGTIYGSSVDTCDLTNTPLEPTITCVHAIYGAVGSTVNPFHAVNVKYNDLVGGLAQPKIYLPPGTLPPSTEWFEESPGNGVYLYSTPINQETCITLLRQVEVTVSESFRNVKVELTDGATTVYATSSETCTISTVSSTYVTCTTRIIGDIGTTVHAFENVVVGISEAYSEGVNIQVTCNMNVTDFQALNGSLGWSAAGTTTPERWTYVVFSANSESAETILKSTRITITSDRLAQIHLLDTSNNIIANSCDTCSFEQGVSDGSCGVIPTPTPPGSGSGGASHPWPIADGFTIYAYDPAGNLVNNISGPQTYNSIPIPIAANLLVPGQTYGGMVSIVRDSTGELEGYGTYKFTYNPPSAETITIIDAENHYIDRDFILVCELTNPLDDEHKVTVSMNDTEVNALNGPSSTNKISLTVPQSVLTYGESYELVIDYRRISDSASFGQVKYVFNYFPPLI